MSFLKISDPLKRDSIVKEYLELKKKIRNNFLLERIGEQQLQTDLSKFYKPITETQKATTREITEGLKPIREGIEKLPEAITFPPTQPLGKASEEEEEEEDEEEEEYEEDEEEEEKLVGKIAYKFLNKQYPDETFGIKSKVKKGKKRYYIGKTSIIIKNNDIILPKLGETFKGTPGLWELIMSIDPENYTDKDYGDYEDFIILTNVLHHNFDEDNPHPRGSKSYKWVNLLSPIWFKKKGGVYKFPKKKEGYEGEGVVVIPSDPNALLERLDLLLASQEAGHTGVRNELVSICDELKRQGVLDTKAYKKLNSNIKK